MQTLTITAGVTVGSYDLLRRLGSGGAATVYEAVHRTLCRRVALKVLHTRPVDVAQGERAAVRFLREARATTRVRHTHVVDVLDFGEADGVAFLAMELVEGETLAQLLGRETKLPLAHAIEILLPILSAVAQLHAAGIVHRDIKPSNILLAGKLDVCPKLSDFGISRSDDGPPSMTQSQNILGTPAYMPPELVLFSATAATERSDQYSLGVTLYECTTGDRPFQGVTTYDTMHSVVSAAAPPPSSRETLLPGAFDEVVLRAMHREPDARFASVAELARALLPFASANVAARWEREFGSPGAGGVLAFSGPEHAATVIMPSSVRPATTSRRNTQWPHGPVPDAVAGSERTRCLARDGLRGKGAESLFENVRLNGLDVFVWLHTRKDPRQSDWIEGCRAYADLVQARRGVLSSLRTFVVSDGGAPNARQRKELFQDALGGYPIKIAVVSPAALHPVRRGVATALSWFNPRFRIFPPSDVALALEHVDIPLESFSWIWTHLSLFQQSLQTETLPVIARALSLSTPWQEKRAFR